MALNDETFSLNNILKVVLAVLILVGIVVYGEYRRMGTEKDITALSQTVASSTAQNAADIKNLNDRIDQMVNQYAAVSNVAQTAQSQSSALQQQVGQINNTAATLDKLSKTDPQLLQKYSKVFFLNENYTPANLAVIPSQYTYEKNKPYQILDGVLPHLTSMIQSAATNGATLIAISAYRSFKTQTVLKSSYTVTYGSGANSFSADQGYSEHQLGTALDFTTPTVAASFAGFDKTPEYTWLMANAYRYGFILSYPQNNTYYEYEPWHWRYVGIDLATRLHNEGKNFYDLDQRVINDYLSVIFD